MFARSPIYNDQDVWLGELGGDLLEERLLPPHQGRLAVDHPHEEVGVQAHPVDPHVQVGLNVHACTHAMFRVTSGVRVIRMGQFL